MANTEKANQFLKGLIEEFKNGTITKTISKIPLIKDKDDDRPCWNWTLRNRILMVKQGSQDARNFAEWNKVGRYIKKGSKAIYILAPIIIKFKPKKEENEKEEPEAENRLIGFRCQTEFKVEDSYGVGLKKYKPAKIPPLTNVAKEWNIKIKYQRDVTGSSLGFTNAKGKDEISLSTENEKTFFHELSHQADKRVNGKLKGGQDPIQEAVAELSSSVLCELHNIDPQKSNTWQYLRNLTKKGSDTETEKLALKVLDRVGKVLDLILTTAQTLEEKKTEKIVMEIKIK